MNLKLRPHQERIINKLRKRWKEKRTHVIYCPAGGGKTAIAAYIANGMIKKGMKVLFLAPYQVLVMQTASRFMGYGLPQPGIIWQNHEWTDTHKAIQVGTIQTQIRRSLPEVDLIIWDEGHIRSMKMLEIISGIDIPVIALSATPFSPWMGEYYESLIKEVTTKELQDLGYLTPFEVYAPIKPDLKGVRTSSFSEYGEDYLEKEIEEIMQGAKVVGNIVDNWLCNGENLPTIAFCCTVLHANHLANSFGSVGVKAEVMDSSTPHEERDRIVKRFEGGITKIICNCGVLIAGFDSDVRCIIYARPTKSEIRWVQATGRGARPAKGKERCLLFDHSGTVHRLGMPDQIEYYELPKESDGMDKAEKARKEKEQKEKLPKECPKCHFMKDAGVFICPKCGFKPRAGEDVEVDESRQIQKIDGKKAPTTAEKQQFYSELCGYRDERKAAGKNYSDGWIAHKFKAKYGEWPNGLALTPLEPSISFRGWMKSQNIRYAKGRAKGNKTLKELKEGIK